MALNETVLQAIKKSFKDVHLDAKLDWISLASTFTTIHWKEGCRRFESLMTSFRIQTNDTYYRYEKHIVKYFCFYDITYTRIIFHLSRNKSPNQSINQLQSSYVG